MSRQARAAICRELNRPVVVEEITVDPPKAGQVMEQSSVIRTGEDGTFVLDSVRNLALFRKTGWYTVSLSFAHAGYEGFVTNYAAIIEMTDAAALQIKPQSAGSLGPNCPSAMKPATKGKNQ